MAIVDHNLLDALRLLTPAERDAIEGLLQNAGSQLQTEALRALRSETLRRLRRMLKRTARRRPETKHRWLM